MFSLFIFHLWTYTGQPSRPSQPDSSIQTEQSTIRPINPGTDAIGVHPPTSKPTLAPEKPTEPIYVVPYPLPIVPSPGACPCYLVDSKNTTNPTQSPPVYPVQPYPPVVSSMYPPNYAVPFGIIGYIPVLFIPYCPGNNTGGQMVQTMFPAAFAVSYPCGQCNSNSGGMPRLFDQPNLYGINNFQQILSQANLNPFDGQIRSPHRRSMRVRKVKTVT